MRASETGVEFRAHHFGPALGGRASYRDDLTREQPLYARHGVPVSQGSRPGNVPRAPLPQTRRTWRRR